MPRKCNAGSVKVACLHQIFNICVSDANKFVFPVYFVKGGRGGKAVCFAYPKKKQKKTVCFAYPKKKQVKSLLCLPDMFPRGDCLQVSTRVGVIYLCMFFFCGIVCTCGGGARKQPKMYDHSPFLTKCKKAKVNSDVCYVGRLRRQ